MRSPSIIMDVMLGLWGVEQPPLEAYMQVNMMKNLILAQLPRRLDPTRVI